MVSLNVHAYLDISRARIPFVVALNQRIHANQIHVGLEHHAMQHEIQFAIVQNQQLEIHSDPA